MNPRFRLGVLVVSLGCFSVPALASYGAAADAGARWEKTLAAARAEGQVTIYGGEEITHPEILGAFQKRYPKIKVVSVSGHSEVMQRIIAERRARKYLVDIFSYGPNAARTAYIAKFLAPIESLLMLPEVTDTSGWYGGRHHYRDPDGKYIFLYEGTPGTASMAYNTKLLKSLEGIDSFWDILDPKWKGKLGFYSYGRGRSVPTPMLTLYYNPDVGPKFLERLFQEMDLTISRDRRQATNWLARGKYPLCFMCRDIEKAQKQGLPVALYPAERIKEAGALGSGNSSVLAYLKNAPHLNASAVFANWFLSREGQSTWQRVMNEVVVESSNSMRTDIGKDNVLASAKRIDGRTYKMLGFLDPRPVTKFYWKLVKEAGKKKKDK